MGRLGAAALVVAALVAGSGAAFAGLAGLPVAESGLLAVLPGAGLAATVGMARGRRLASWAALWGGVLVFALGVGLYGAALESPRPLAVPFALGLVPMRQLAGVAVVGWAVWLTRRVRE